MTMRRILSTAAVAVLGGSLTTSAWAQGTPGCQPGTGPFDHLKCYKIATRQKVKVSADLTPLQPQFQFEKGCKVSGPVLFCVPVCKSNVQPPPQGGVSPLAPQEGDHFCYKITCPKTTPTLTGGADQFGTFQPLKFLKANLLCTPAIKVGVTTSTTSTSTITTTSTSTSTTTSTIHCMFSPATNGCIGGCQDPMLQCQRISATVCDCVKPPVCCDCGPVPPPCFNTNGVCPAGCLTVPNATCNAATGHCECGFCRDANTCNGKPCSANQTCPGAPTVVCDPNCGPNIGPPNPGSGTCDPCNQSGTCSPVQCLKADGTPGQCHPSSTSTCGCL